MSDQPPHSKPDDGGLRLERCIRDLAALNALPSMCIGRSPDEALDIVLDALPTALSCNLVYLSLPESPPKERASLNGRALEGHQLADLRTAIEARANRDALVLSGGERLWYLEAELPVGAGRGRLVAGRRSPLDPEIDRVLVRTAANLVGTTLETANVLEAAHRKDEFLAMLGHELRNPLAPIVTAVELLGRNPSAAREQQVIHRHTRHLARLVDDLLDISRVTRGHVELRSEQVSLDSVLERAVEIASPLVTRQQHLLRVANATGVTVRGDGVRLAQIFGNLLTNAAKFTSAGGKIDVAVEHHDDRVRVTVRDNGRGIAPEKMRTIFAPFVQIDRKRDALNGGLGLGLAIVRNLVERHGGTITVVSEGEGRGSAFTVELPTEARIEMPASAEVFQGAPARAGVRVLVVDDNVDIAELLSEALRCEGFDTAIAHDARGALERWRDFVPHAGVLDVGLPGIDGYDLARRIRAEHGKDLTLIAATGYGERKDRLRAVDAGFDCHFIKPVSVQELVLALDHRVVGAARQATAP